MIREMNKFDLEYFISIIHKIHQSEFMDWARVTLDDRHITQIFTEIIAGRGFGYIAMHNDNNVGITVGLINPNIWHPTEFLCHQIVLYVEPDYRKGRIGHELITAYNNKCEEYKQNNRIYGYTVSASETMFDTKFDRYGYKLLEKVWLQ